MPCAFCNCPKESYRARPGDAFIPLAVQAGGFLPGAGNCKNVYLPDLFSSRSPNLCNFLFSGAGSTNSRHKNCCTANHLRVSLPRYKIYRTVYILPATARKYNNRSIDSRGPLSRPGYNCEASISYERAATTCARSPFCLTEMRPSHNEGRRKGEYGTMTGVFLGRC